MHKIDVSADLLVDILLRLETGRDFGLLDSCGVGRPDSNILIAGIDPVERLELSGNDANATLKTFDEQLNSNDRVAIFTISYDFGLKLNGLLDVNSTDFNEPDIFLALFDCIVVHDYDRNRTFLAGDPEKSMKIGSLFSNRPYELREPFTSIGSDVKQPSSSKPRSNFTPEEYIAAVDQIKELIRAGETYQTNLTQQLTVKLQKEDSPEKVFLKLRRNHPAPFAAFIRRQNSTVVSASPEEFIRVQHVNGVHQITASPIKGTRRRGENRAEDERLRAELVASEKDRAENTMIVDLMRNDLGRICEFGSVTVEDLCRTEEHPTLFHLVSTVSGVLKRDRSFSDIIRATFPCGSITGAPKIRTMEIIEKMEPTRRGLSMGAIGCFIPAHRFGLEERFEMSVAIRTMVIRDQTASFNVGGGIVIDSEPRSEYEESMLKAKALLQSLAAN